MPDPSSIKQWEAWRNKELPPVEQIAANVWCLPVLIPDHPLGFTFIYALRGDNDEILLIDTGWPDERSWESLQSQAALAGFDLSQVTGIVITHQHPDHHGLTYRVQQLSGAWVGMHVLDAASLEEHFSNIEKGATGMPDSVIKMRREKLRQAGTPESVATELITMSSEATGSFSERSHPDVLLQDGDRVKLAGRDVRVVWTPGHTAGNICVFDADNNILFAGDHILPRISPNIGMNFSSDRKSLKDYFDSLAKVEAYSGAHVAPAHEYRFDDLVPRIKVIRAHHEQRLDEIHAIISSGTAQTQWDISANLSWSRGWQAIRGIMKFAALGETVAHLEVLEDRGLIAAEGSSDDTIVYRALA